LAAPQIGLSQRVIVLDVDHENKGNRLLKLINPVIAEREGEIVWEEGCLSVRDYVAEVDARGARSRAWLHARGQRDRDRGRRSPAVALQHEIDSPRRQALPRSLEPP